LLIIIGVSIIYYFGISINIIIDHCYYCVFFD